MNSFSPCRKHAWGVSLLRRSHVANGCFRCLQHAGYSFRLRVFLISRSAFFICGLMALCWLLFLAKVMHKTIFSSRVRLSVAMEALVRCCWTLRDGCIDCLPGVVFPACCTNSGLPVNSCAAVGRRDIPAAPARVSCAARMPRCGLSSIW
ncbi:hypothetical protein FQZ97_1102570 [compost metagenome]